MPNIVSSLRKPVIVTEPRSGSRAGLVCVLQTVREYEKGRRAWACAEMQSVRTVMRVSL
jgi:hypothetical protein